MPVPSDPRPVANDLEGNRSTRRRKKRRGGESPATMADTQFEQGPEETRVYKESVPQLIPDSPHEDKQPQEDSIATLLVNELGHARNMKDGGADEVQAAAIPAVRRVREDGPSLEPAEPPQIVGDALLNTWNGAIGKGTFDLNGAIGKMWQRDKENNPKTREQYTKIGGDRERQRGLRIAYL